MKAQITIQAILTTLQIVLLAVFLTAPDVRGYCVLLSVLVIAVGVLRIMVWRRLKI